jgi:outer membrane receptor protein involved in Fe transport
MPRATLLLGPVEGFTVSFSVGRGARSVDPQYVTQDTQQPFARLDAWEGGVVFARHDDALDLVARSIFFQTRVERDLIFSQTEGRNVLAGATTRTGWIGAVRARGEHFDELASLTLVRSEFDDTGLLIPYVPDVVARSETAFFAEVGRLSGRAVKGTLSVGGSFVGRRPLPYGERSGTILVFDAAATAEWSAFDLTLSVTNLLDRRYALGEYNYTSDFRSAALPTLVPARHFTAGAPRMVMLTAGVTFGGPS